MKDQTKEKLMKKFSIALATLLLAGMASIVLADDAKKKNQRRKAKGVAGLGGH